MPRQDNLPRSRRPCTSHAAEAARSELRRQAIEELQAAQAELRQRMRAVNLENDQLKKTIRDLCRQLADEGE